MEKRTKLLLTFVLMLISVITNAQETVEMADTMRSNGKIYVVVGIIVIILAGLVLYLGLLDRKVKKLQELLGQKNSQTKK